MLGFAIRASDSAVSLRSSLFETLKGIEDIRTSILKHRIMIS